MNEHLYKYNLLREARNLVIALGQCRTHFAKGERVFLLALKRLHRRAVEFNRVSSGGFWQ